LSSIPNRFYLEQVEKEIKGGTTNPGSPVKRPLMVVGMCVTVCVCDNATIMEYEHHLKSEKKTVFKMN